MQFPHIILTLLFLFSLLLNQANSADMIEYIPSIIGMGKTNTMSCFQCTNTTDPGCNNILSKNSTFAMKCRAEATGCVKKLYDYEGWTVMSRECYYGARRIVVGFDCEGTNSHFPREKCFKCYENLCNSSSTFYGLTTTIFILILAAAVVKLLAL